jgi:hypothetical protein
LASAPSPAVFSPIKKQLMTREQRKALDRATATATFDIDSDASEPHATRDETKEIEYLPLPRTRANPNARGGAITVQPKAPTIRLDKTLAYRSSPQKYGNLLLYDIMADLGILERPRVGEGKPITSKKVQKVTVESSIRSVIRMERIN